MSYKPPTINRRRMVRQDFARLSEQAEVSDLKKLTSTRLPKLPKRKPKLAPYPTIKHR